MRLAITKDTANIIGNFAEAVENRSLLLDKFVCHKQWPEEKMDDASRWSFMRITANGESLLNSDANGFERRANGRDASQQNKERYSKLANVARCLARTSLSKTERELQDLQQAHTRSMLALIHQSRFASKTIVARLEARMAINLADGLIQNAGIALHRLFGLPYIPGSAVKGIARAIALQQLKNTSDIGKRKEILYWFVSIFGTTKDDFKNDLAPFWDLLGEKDLQDQKGAISFLPAHALDNTQIVVDITNVHTPDYYRSGKQADLKNETPRPNPFPAVDAGSSFAFFLLANRKIDSSLLEQADAWLREGLSTHGIGAKTAAGYGWFQDENPETSQNLYQEAHRQAEKIAEEIALAESQKKAHLELVEKRAKMSPEERRADDFWQQTQGHPEEIKAVLRTSPTLDVEGKRAVLHLCRNQANQIWQQEYAEYQRLVGNPKKQAKSKAFARVKSILDVASEMKEKL